VLVGLRLALGLLTIVPGGTPDVGRRAAGRAMLWAPAVGALVGLAAGAVVWAAGHTGLGAGVSAVLAVALLAVLTRGLHLDGLADTADGLGSGPDRYRALAVMRASDVGPFGVVTLLLVVLAQVLALAQSQAAGHGASAVLVAATTGRAVLPWACYRGVPSARPEGLGALVAGTVGAVAAVVCAVLVAAFAAGVGVLTGLGPVHAVVAVLVGLAAALALLVHVGRRLGGITGDVLGALVEVATTAALLVLAAG